MITVLCYPRSGSTLLQCFLTNHKPSLPNKKLHGHDIVNNNISGLHGDSHWIIMLIRNYKEGILSHLTRDDDQFDMEKINQAFMYYTKVLNTYEKSTCKKTFQYYEDLIEDPVKVLNDISNTFGFNFDHIIENIDIYLDRGRSQYIKRHGPTQTNGKEKIHFSSSIKHNYNFDWDQKMKQLNPILYNKYLSHYGDIT